MISIGTFRSDIVRTPQHSVITGFADDEDFAGIVPLEDIRDYLGIFGDTSDNNLIHTLSQMAVKEIELIVGQSIIPRTVTDHYQLFHDYHILSQKGAITSLSRFYINASNTSVSLTDAHIIDTSGDEKRVVFTGGAPDYELSEDIANPVSMAYTSGMPLNMTDSVRNAFLYIINHLYFNRGDTIANVDKRHIYRVLAPFKGIVG